MKTAEEIKSKLNILTQSGSKSKTDERILFAKIDTLNWVLSGDNYAAQFQQEWVDVKERLPEEGLEVIVFDKCIVEGKDYSETTTAIYTLEHLRPIFTKKNGYVLVNVTHWQPLPSPPKEK